MKFMIQKQTGLEETSVVELDPNVDDIQQAYAALDGRLSQTNRKIVEVREFIQEIKDPNYRYLFVAFMDQFLGISSQAESLLKKFQIEPPMHFDEWVRKKETAKEPAHVVKIAKPLPTRTGMSRSSRWTPSMPSRAS